MVKALVGLFLAFTVSTILTASTINLNSALVNAGFEASQGFAVTADVASGSIPNQAFQAGLEAANEFLAAKRK